MKFETLNEVIISLILWISTHTSHPKPQNDIKVEFIDQKKLQQIACKKPCEIMAYTPKSQTEKIYLINGLEPLTDVCHQAILMHEIIHIIQEENGYADEFDEKTKKHMREMNALVNHNIFLSQYGKKILYSNGFAAKFKTNDKNNLYC